MAHDECLAERVLRIIGDQPTLTQMKRFGGLAFMLQGNIACGVIGVDPIVRVPKDKYTETLTPPHVRQMDHTGRPKRGWVVVAPAATNNDDALRDWVQSGAAYALSLPAK